MKIITTLIALIMAATAFGQQSSSTRNNEMQTLLGQDRSFGGFFGFGTKLTELNDQGALMVGGELQAVFGHSLNIGFAGYGLVTDVYGQNVDDLNRRLYYEMGYGGMVIEPVFGSMRLVHLSTPVFFGAGGIGENHRRYVTLDGVDNDTAFPEPYFYNSDFFLFIEPGVQAELNLLRYVRAYAGVSYRWVTDVDLPNTSVQQLGGFSGNVGLRFGWF